jgi:hypothetical protein
MLQNLLSSHLFSSQDPTVQRWATETAASLASYKALFQEKQGPVTA